MAERVQMRTLPNGTKVRVTTTGERRALAYAVVDRSRDGAPMLRTFQKREPARRYAKKMKATLVAKYAGHAGFTVLEDYSEREGEHGEAE